MTTTDLALPDAAQIGALAPAMREQAVTQYLENARDRLALALQVTGPEAVASLRAEIATAAEATKQLGLSKEIQLDAQEMVRRAEYALGKAIRKGQREGEIRRRGQGGGQPPWTATPRSDNTLSSPEDFASHSELVGQSGKNNGIYSLVDAATDDDFEDALAEAKSEGNVSRANVVRKIKAEPSRRSATQQVEQIVDLASAGNTSAQIGRALGVTEQWVRQIARDNSLDIPADRVMGRGHRRVDSTRIAQETVNALEGLAMGVAMFDPNTSDVTQAEHWATSLDDSLRALNRFRKQIKEMTQ